MRPRRPLCALTCALAALSLAACAETVELCDEGFARSDATGECVPLDGGATDPDAGADPDAGPDGGSTPPDAGVDAAADASVPDGGPCAEDCAARGELCDAASGACVECTAADTTRCTGAETLCSPEGSCVECLGASDCGEAAPICDGGACRQCGVDAECEAISSAAPYCHRGECEACSPDPTKEAEACGANSCSALTFTCTSQPRDALSPCEPCEADSECAGARRCVLHTFDDGGTIRDVGYFCTIDRDMAGGSCASATVEVLRPYSTVVATTSINGHASTYCLPPEQTTCIAIQRATAETSCSTRSDCGMYGTDGFCPLSGSPDQFVCTYVCSSDADCESLASGERCRDTPPRCL